MPHCAPRWCGNCRTGSEPMHLVADRLDTLGSNRNRNRAAAALMRERLD